VALPVIALAGDGLSELDLQAYHSLMAVVDTNHVQASHGGTIDVAGARARAEQLVQQDLERLHDLMRLAQYPDFDAYTVGHSVRVALLVTLVAERLGLPKERMVELAAAALLHDVGKAQVPYDILFKPGPLNADERRIMETHPRLGGEMLLASGVANPWSVCAAFGHHVRHDRRGYPKLPVWARQSSATALIHVCDVFEALSAVRPYKPAFAPWDAYDIMVRDQGGFDPGALRVFVNAIGLFPPGSNVVLSDGSEGFVVRAGERPDRPSVQIRKRADGVAVDLDAAETCDLSDPANAELRVVRLLAPVHDAAESEEAAAVEAELARRPRSGPAEPIPIDPCDPAPA
jgi:putative nucleotidyltransferase with HDIG domain